MFIWEMKDFVSVDPRDEVMTDRLLDVLFRVCDYFRIADPYNDLANSEVVNGWRCLNLERSNHWPGTRSHRKGYLYTFDCDEWHRAKFKRRGPFITEGEGFYSLMDFDHQWDISFYSKDEKDGDFICRCFTITHEGQVFVEKGLLLELS